LVFEKDKVTQCMNTMKYPEYVLIRKQN